jgi:hypothetical protein
MAMDRAEEHAFYENPEHQVPQGPARRRKKPLTELVPVRFDEETIDAVRRRAESDDRSVSAWIRRAVQHELSREASA